MAADLGVGTPFVFGAFSAAALLHALLSQVLGKAVDRRGGRGLLAVSSLVFAAGLVGLALSQTPVQFCAAWLVMGLGMSLGLYDIAFASLVGWFGAQARNPITGVTLIAGFASTVGWPLTAWLEAHYGWRGACLFWAGAHLVVALPLHLTLRPAEAVAPHATAAGPAPRLAPRVARQMALMAVAFAAMAVIGSAISADLPPMLMALGVTPVAALAAAALVGPAQVAARLAEFVAFRRLHPLWSARLAVGLFPAGALLFLALGAPSAAVFAILYGAGNGLFTIARGSLPLAMFGPGGYGARLGLISVPGRFAQAFAPFGFALLSVRSPYLGLWTLVGISVVGLACLLILRAEPAEGS